MRWSSYRRVGAAVLLSAILLALSACTTKPVGPPLVMGHSVRGKVTYRGEPVTVGFVQFFSLGHSLDEKTRTNTALGVAEIKNGKYEMLNAPEGPVQIAVVTDPDMDLVDMVRPRAVGPGGAPVKGGPPGGPPMGPPGGPPGGPPNGPPGGPPGPPPNGPPGPPGVGPESSPVLPPGAPKMELPSIPSKPNPLTENLTPAQKAVLKEIHAKYGDAVQSHLNYVVRPGEDEQTHDIELK